MQDEETEEASAAAERWEALSNTLLDCWTHAVAFILSKYPRAPALAAAAVAAEASLQEREPVRVPRAPYFVITGGVVKAGRTKGLCGFGQLVRRGRYQPAQTFRRKESVREY